MGRLSLESCGLTPKQTIWDGKWASDTRVDAKISQQLPVGRSPPAEEQGTVYDLAAPRGDGLEKKGFPTVIEGVLMGLLHPISQPPGVPPESDSGGICHTRAGGHTAVLTPSGAMLLVIRFPDGQSCVMKDKWKPHR